MFRDLIIRTAKALYATCNQYSQRTTPEAALVLASVLNKNKTKKITMFFYSSQMRLGYLLFSTAAAAGSSRCVGKGGTGGAVLDDTRRGHPESRVLLEEI